MPTSFQLFLCLTIGVMMTLIGANHLLGPAEYSYNWLVDQTVDIYIITFYAFVFWWGVMWRLDTVALTGFVVLPIEVVIVNAMTTVDDAEYTQGILSDPNAIVALIMTAIVILVLFLVGAGMRLIAEIIVSLGNRQAQTY